MTSIFVHPSEGVPDPCIEGGGVRIATNKFTVLGWLKCSTFVFSTFRIVSRYILIFMLKSRRKFNIWDYHWFFHQIFFLSKFQIFFEILDIFFETFRIIFWWFWGYPLFFSQKYQHFDGSSVFFINIFNFFEIFENFLEKINLIVFFGFMR